MGNFICTRRSSSTGSGSRAWSSSPTGSTRSSSTPPRRTLSEVYESFRISNPAVLGRVVEQRGSTCWAIAIARLLEAMYRLHDPDFPPEVHLSIQDLINQLRRGYRRMGTALSDDGGIQWLEHTQRYIRRGLVSEDVCPLTFSLDPPSFAYEANNPPRYSIRELMVFNWFLHFHGDFADMESFILSELEDAPVLISIPAFDSFVSLPNDFGKQVYTPTEEEQIMFNDRKGDHVMLCCGHGVTEDGVHYLECQETRGPGFADGGFVRIALGHRLFRSCAVMSF